MELVNKERFKDLLWFRVEMSYDIVNALDMTKPLSAYFRISLWRDETNATSAEIQAILSQDSILLPNEKKEAIIVCLPEELGRSFKVDEKINWGGPQLKVGEIIIKELLIPNTL